MYKVLIGKVEVINNGTQSVLFNAVEKGVSIDHNCSDGRCGTCKTRVLSGTWRYNSEPLSITKKEHELGYCLTCLAIPTSDLTLELEDLSAYAVPESKTLPVKVDSLAFFGDVCELTLRFSPKEQFTYLPGQYVNLIVGDVRRSYSIAGSDGQKLKFLIRKYSGGKFSTYLFERAKVNDLLRMEGPKGTFFMRHSESPEKLIFLATGTGIAPFLPMIESWRNNPYGIKELYLYYGKRYAEEFECKVNGIQGVSYTTCLSREEQDGCEKGYVQHVALNQHQHELNKVAVYACGSEAMINEARSLFIQKGLPVQHFYADAFFASNPL